MSWIRQLRWRPAEHRQMANSTMETFFQPGNCFNYHTDDNGNMLGTRAGPDGFTGGLSHIRAATLPLSP
jgi:hypothetical protein